MIMDNNKNETRALIHAEQVDNLYKSLPISIFANYAAGLILTVSQWKVIDHFTLLLWLSFVILINTGRGYLFFKYKNLPAKTSAIPQFSRLFNIGVTASAIALGIAGILLLPDNDPLHQVICAFVLIGMSAGALSTLSIGKHIYTVYISVILIPLIIYFFLIGSEFTFIVPLMILLTYLFLLINGLRIYKNTERNIETRINAQKNELDLLLYKQKHHLYIANTTQAYIEWSTDFKVIQWNPAAEKIFGYRYDEAIGAYGPDLIVPENCKAEINVIWQALLNQTGGSESTNDNITATGNIITCEWQNTPLINTQGECIGVASTARNITQRLKAETEIIETKNMLQTVLNTIPVRVFWKDKENKYLGCNALFAGDAGLSSPDEIVGLNDFEMPWHEQANAYINDDQHVMKNDQPRIAYEEPQTQHSGLTTWVETSKIPLKNSNGVIYGVLGTYSDITERKEAEEKILIAMEEAEMARNAKDQFLTRMSHELRTPLNAILGFAQLLDINNDNLDDDQLESVKYILSAGHRLLKMINDVLEISDMDSQDIIKHTETISVENIIRESVDSLQTPLAEKNISVSFNTDKDITIENDKLRLQQVLVSVLSNAIKFNKTNGEILINAQQVEQDYILIQIKDTGVGIKESDLPKIFDPFYKVDELTIPESDVGIGLAIVKRILQIMNSTIRAESEPGSGTLFEIKMPLKQNK